MSDQTSYQQRAEKLRVAGATPEEIQAILGADSSTGFGKGMATPVAPEAKGPSLGRQAANAGIGAVQGLTVGFGDELYGGLGALQGKAGGTLKERYLKARDRFRDREQEARAENPGLTAGAEFVSGMATPTGFLAKGVRDTYRGVKAAPGVWNSLKAAYQAAKTGAKVGGVMGTAHGVGRAGDNRRDEFMNTDDIPGIALEGFGGAAAGSVLSGAGSLGASAVRGGKHMLAEARALKQAGHLEATDLLPKTIRDVFVPTPMKNARLREAKAAKEAARAAKAEAKAAKEAAKRNVFPEGPGLDPNVGEPGYSPPVRDMPGSAPVNGPGTLGKIRARQRGWEQPGPELVPGKPPTIPDDGSLTIELGSDLKPPVRRAVPAAQAPDHPLALTPAEEAQSIAHRMGRDVTKQLMNRPRSEWPKILSELPEDVRAITLRYLQDAGTAP